MARAVATVAGLVLPLAALGGAAGCQALPALEILPVADQQVRVMETLTVELRALNARGDEVWGFSVPTIPDIEHHADIYQDSATATFRWTPLATHVATHQFTFTVSSGVEYDSETVDIEVLPADAAPRFLHPSAGGTYDLSVDPEIVVPIEVLDEDSTSVVIRQRAPLIVGGDLFQLDGFSAEFRWRPTAEQVSDSLRYTLRLEADDGENPPVQHDYQIILIGD